MSFTHGDLFAGIGGFTLGFERAGFRTQWHVENDPACMALLARRWPGVPLYGDVRGVTDLSNVDVLTFGSPCQDLSVAGNRAGLEGARSGLFYEGLRIAVECGVSFAVWENVTGAFSSNAGRDFAAVLTAFRECGARDICWRVLDAQYFGVAQRRRRVFIVADFRGERAAEVLFESGGVPRNPTKGRKTRAQLASAVAASLRNAGSGSRGWTGDAETGLVVPDIAPCLTGGAGTERTGNDTEAGYLIANAVTPGQRVAKQDGADTLIAATLTASLGHHGYSSPRGTNNDNLIAEAYTVHSENSKAMQGQGEAAVAFPVDLARSLDTKGGYASNQGGTVIAAYGGNDSRGERDVATTLQAHRNTGRIDWESETFIAATLGAQLAQQSQPDGMGVFIPDEIVATLNSGGNNGGFRTEPGEHLIIHRGVRRLTPRECERLQGFPDDWTDGQADSTRYHQLGNAVAEPVTFWIAQRLLRVLEST